MALDGITLHFIKNELENRLRDTRVDRVQQPERDEIDLAMRGRDGMARLLLSASPANPRAHLSALTRENPPAPPMFCMLLRKHLGGARFSGIRQPGLERVLFFDFNTRNELGDEVTRTLCIEIMGRHSDIILLDGDGKILDAVKRIDAARSSVRQVLPGLSYHMPPAQDKLDPLSTPPAELTSAVFRPFDEGGRDGSLPAALLKRVMGVSPVVCRELCQRSCRAPDVPLSAVSEEGRERLTFFFGRLADDVRAGRGVPVMVSDPATRRPLDFSFLELTQYGASAVTRRFPGFSELLDAFYGERDRAERFASRSQDMLRLLARLSEHTARRLKNREQELRDCAGRDRLRIFGDLLTAGAASVPHGASVCELPDYYREDSPAVRIRLDPRLTAIENAQRYYKEYRKKSVAEQVMRSQIEGDRRELAYIDSVFDELSRAKSERELDEIREELTAGGYLKPARGQRSGRQKPGRPRAGRLPESRPVRYCSSDGLTIRVGRNNRQNDRLTMKTAAKTDLWLHTRNIPGAHVIVEAQGRPVPARTISEAATLAALHSKAGQSRQVPVDYTWVKYVKKPPGAKPGMVTYDRFRTAVVNPDPLLDKRLRRPE